MTEKEKKATEDPKLMEYMLKTWQMRYNMGLYEGKSKQEVTQETKDMFDDIMAVPGFSVSEDYRKWLFKAVDDFFKTVKKTDDLPPDVMFLFEGKKEK